MLRVQETGALADQQLTCQSNKGYTQSQEPLLLLHPVSFALAVEILQPGSSLELGCISVVEFLDTTQVLP